MTYGCETRPLLVDVKLKFERAEMQMIRGIMVSHSETEGQMKPYRLKLTASPAS